MWTISLNINNRKYEIVVILLNDWVQKHVVFEYINQNRPRPPSGLIRPRAQYGDLRLRYLIWRNISSSWFQGQGQKEGVGHGYTEIPLTVIFFVLWPIETVSTPQRSRCSTIVNFNPALFVCISNYTNGIIFWNKEQPSHYLSR